MLEMLHEGHPGMVRMKSLARGYLWWPELDKDIEQWVATCHACQETKPMPPKTTPMKWEQPRGPWSRIHIDFAGPVKSQSFLIVVDAYSKWLEVVLMASTTTSATIRALRKLFATHGIPDTLVSDNGPQLTARQMETYLAELGIRHILVAPYSPASNGRAERMVRLTKEALTKIEGGDWQEKVDKFLTAQHITPCASTGKSPAELLMGRKLRTTLDRLHPYYNNDTLNEHMEPERSLGEGEPVYARSYDGDSKWEPATIIQKTGPKSYKLILEDGREWHRHIDQLRRRPLTASLRGIPEHLNPTRRHQDEGNVEPDSLPDLPRVSSGAPGDSQRRPGGQEAGEARAASTPGGASRDQASRHASGGAAGKPTSPTEGSSTTELRRSGRTRQQPIRLQDYVTWLND